VKAFEAYEHDTNLVQLMDKHWMFGDEMGRLRPPSPTLDAGKLAEQLYESPVLVNGRLPVDLDELVKNARADTTQNAPPHGWFARIKSFFIRKPQQAISGWAKNTADALEYKIAFNVANDHVSTGLLRWVPKNLKGFTRGAVEKLVSGTLRTMCNAKNSPNAFMQGIGYRMQSFAVNTDPRAKTNPVLSFVSHSVFNLLCNLRKLNL
jgi:hypothetical protein